MADLAPFSRITRIQPFTGLVIDPPTRGAAHDYHRLYQRLHLISLHGSGIAQGLAVLPTDPPGGAVVVEPGVAVDDAGEVIVVPERERVTIDARAGSAYLALAFHEATPARTDGAPEVDPQEARGRVVEHYRIDVLDARPEPPALELARIALAAGGELVVTAAPNPWAPGVNEIDGRYRPQLSGPPVRDLRIALVASGPTEELQADHLQGFGHLLDACAVAGLRVSPQFAANGELPDADLLYVTGRADVAPEPALVDGLSERLRGGSWLFADGCGAGSAFAEGLGSLVSEDAGTAGLETESLVTDAHYVFGAAPDGACEGELRWGSRALVSARDFGCAWRGRYEGGPLPRSRIRDALEFGVNVAVCAGGYARSR